MKFLVDAFIKPFLAMVFFLGFGGWWLFIGFQSVTVNLERSSDQVINGTVTRKHLLGLYTVTTALTGVTEADRLTHGDSSPMLRGVVIEAKSGPVSLFGGFEFNDTKYKSQIITKLNNYITSGKSRSFHETFHIWNFAMWFGLPFFLMGVFGVLTWPITIVSCWKKRKEAVSIK